MRGQITTAAGSLGVGPMPDGRDSGRCHLRCGNDAVVRINLDGIWTTLCEDHRALLTSWLELTP